MGQMCDRSAIDVLRQWGKRVGEESLRALVVEADVVAEHRASQAQHLRVPDDALQVLVVLRGELPDAHPHPQPAVRPPLLQLRLQRRLRLIRQFWRPQLLLDLGLAPTQRALVELCAPKKPSLRPKLSYKKQRIRSLIGAESLESGGSLPLFLPLKSTRIFTPK